MTNPSSSICRSEAGLSLLEILIAIAILAFVMIGVVSIIDNSQNTKDRTVQLDRDNLQIETAMARLEWDFSQIWSPLYFSKRFSGNLDPQNNPGIEEVAYLYEGHPRFRMPSKEGLPIPKFFLREKNDLLFLTTANRRKLENQRQSHFMWVRYYLGDVVVQDDKVGAGEERTVKALLRQTFIDDPWAKEDIPIEDTRSSVVLENVEKLEFALWDPKTKKWTENTQAITDGESLWRGLQVTVTWKDSAELERTTVRWFRPQWSAPVPQDPDTATTSGAQAGAQAGAQGGANSGAQGGSTGGTNSGDQGGDNGGDE